MDSTNLSTKSLSLQAALLAIPNQAVLNAYSRQVLQYLDKSRRDDNDIRRYEARLARATSRKRSR